MLDLFWDLFQQGQINNLHDGRLSQLEKEKSQDNKADSLEARLQELEQRHEQLKLVTLAFWSLLRDHAGLLESDLRKYVEKIDLLDGKQDGKVTKAIGKVTCTGCDRSLLATSAVCVYCGTPLKRGDLFTGA
jgi:type I site-specific restriction endonuclease